MRHTVGLALRLPVAVEERHSEGVPECEALALAHLEAVALADADRHCVGV